MTNRWNNKEINIPVVTCSPPTSTSILSSSSSSSSSQQVPLSLLPPTSSPLTEMLYHQSHPFNPYQTMSHQADRIIPHGRSGKKKRGTRYFSPEASYSPQTRQPRQRQASGPRSSALVTQNRYHPIKDGLIQDMEMELDFLKGECSTISIILSSLRTAFLRDDTDTFYTSTSFLPFTSSAMSSFSSFSLSSIASSSQSTSASSTAKSLISTPSSSSSSSPPSLQLTSQRKADREKEMRAGYDELLLQIRHLEKKVDSLESKIRQLSMDKHKKPRY